VAVKWKRVWIADEGYESAAVFDVDGDGVPDIVSGAFWYRGPDFRAKCPAGPSAKLGEYYDDFSTIALDVNGDGRTDYVTGGWWGGTLRWCENPGDPSKEWPVHDIARVGSIETTRAWDIDGCGVPEIVPNCPGSAELAVFKPARGGFRKMVVHRFPAETTQGHGLGCGDVAGNGRMDIVTNHGWLEAPRDPWKEEWRWHEGPAVGSMAGVPILVADVNGDGRSELVAGNGHGYGLDWWSRDAAGTWIRHPIDPFSAQFHDLQWADIDGDGTPELVTGKRHRAHCGNEAGEWDDLGIYYYKWNGESFTKNVVSYGPIGVGKGCGIRFALADLRGTGRLDIVAPGKDGLAVFFNEGEEPRALP
jgi:hypothetical protein